MYDDLVQEAGKNKMMVHKLRTGKRYYKYKLIFFLSQIGWNFCFSYVCPQYNPNYVKWINIQKYELRERGGAEKKNKKCLHIKLPAVANYQHYARRITFQIQINQNVAKIYADRNVRKV